MQHRPLGTTGPHVSALGLECMGLSGMYGPSERSKSIATINAGITLFDTGDFFGMGHNEMVLNEALQGTSRDRALISVKSARSAIPPADGRASTAGPKRLEASSRTPRAALAATTSTRPPARLDPDVPVEETIGAIADMVKAEYVRHIGLSELGPKRSAEPHRSVRSPIYKLSIR